MASIRNLSIKRRLVIINLSTTGIVLLLAVFALFANYYFSLRRSLIEEMSLHAKMIGQNCTAALSFNDHEAAEEMLNSLKADPAIIYAAVYNNGGALFAEIPNGNSGEKHPPSCVPPGEGYRIEKRCLCVLKNIVLDGEIIGTIYLTADLNELYTPLLWYGCITGAVVAGSLAFAFLMIANLQKIITGPVLLLRQAANRIAQNDFAVRAEIASRDEIGELAVSFNKMAEHLQRTTVSKDYVDNIIKSMAESLIVTAPDGAITTVNQVACELLGYREHELAGKPISLILKDNQTLFRDCGGRHDKTLPDNPKEHEAIRHTETMYISKTGRKIPVLLSAAFMKKENGESQGIVLVALDITMRKNMEEELRSTIEQRNKTIAELKHLMYFSSLMNDEVHEASLFHNLGKALKEYFCPDVLAVIMIDNEKNILAIPVIDPPMPETELIKPEIILNPSLCRVLHTGKELIVGDMCAESVCDCLVSKHSEGGCICIPLTMEGLVAGMVLMIKKGHAFWDDGEIRKLLVVYRGLASAALSRVRLMEFTKHAAITDALTGVYNRRFFDDMFEKQLALAKRSNEPLSILLADLDHFKKLNDTHGHITGDKALQQAAKVIKKCLRSSDILARYGGEEFVIIMPATNIAHAAEKAELVRRQVKLLQIDTTAAEPPVLITISIGAASFPQHGPECNALLRSADAALYSAKENGRDRVELA